jgi:hypothetical protein
MYKIICSLILILLVVPSLPAQEKVSFDTITSRMAEQLNMYPKEKLHVHIDRSCYLPGDTLWFKAYMVNASSHIPIRLSRYVYVELVNPENETIDRVKIRPDEMNQFHGYISIPEDLPGGNYSLLAYTCYMLFEENQPVFKRDVCIALASNWETAHLKANILSPHGEITGAQLQLWDNSQKQIPLKRVKAVCNKGKPVSAKLYDEGKIELRIQNEKVTSEACMRIDMTDIRNNVFRQYAAISTGTEDYDVTFYPEGGYLLEGTPCRTAYKVLDVSGNSIAATLQLMDEQGNVMATSETLHSGMGVFTFTPESGKRYIVQTSNKQGVKKVFELPPVQSSAYGIVIKDHQEDMQISINSALHSPHEELLLLAHVRGKMICAQWLLSDKGDIITIAKDQYPSGIVQCLLLDKNYNVLSERLGFIPYRKAIMCKVRNDKDSYGKRELIHTNLSLVDVNGNPVKGNLSVAITDKSMAVADTTHSILSTLLLSSELKGRIETPSFYLQTDNPEAEKALDLLLMIHGWKRYRLPEIIKGNFERPVMEPEKFTSLSGRLKNEKGEGKSRYDVYVRNLEFGLNRVIKLGQDGAFRVDSVEFAEGVPIGMIGKRFIRKGENYGRNKAEIILDKDQLYILSDKTVPQPFLSEISGGIQRDMVYPVGMSDYLLNQVTVKSKLLNKRLTLREIAKFKFKNMWELVDYMGVKFKYPYYTSTMKGSCKASVKIMNAWACFYKDMPLVLMINGNMHSNAGILNYLSLSDIQVISLNSIDRKKILKPYLYLWEYEQHTSVAILELVLYPGVILDPLLHLCSIEQRFKGYGKLDDIQTDVYPSGGYQEPVAFYSPKYDKGNKDNALIPDFRSTLYWNPSLQTDSSGECDFLFYSADKATTYKVVIEGLTEEGEMVYETREFEIK